MKVQGHRSSEQLMEDNQEQTPFMNQGSLWSFNHLGSYNKWHRGTWEISRPPDIAVGTHSHEWHGTKTIPVFLPVDGKASWLLLPNMNSLLSDGTVQPEKTYSYMLKVRGQVCESQKRISISNSHSYHQHSSPSASLNWCNNKVRFSFIQPNRKKWGARLIDVKTHIPHCYCQYPKRVQIIMTY